MASGISSGAYVTDSYSGNENVINITRIPPEVKTYEKDWPLPNKDYRNTRFTTNSTINSKNIGKIHLIWNYTIVGKGPFGGANSNPLILGDTIYFQDAGDNILALDRSTGVVKWIYKANISSTVGPNGPAVGWGKVFAANDSYSMIALDSVSGKPIWSRKLSSISSTGVDIQPLVYNNLLFTSTVPGAGDLFYAPGGIGVIYALDVDTGLEKWSFSTVDSPDIWGNPKVNSGGGSWYPPAVDEKSGSIFWGTGNPAPFAGTKEYPNGASRPGPNLYSSSILSLNYKDGKLNWFRQVVPHDLFDYDFQVSPILTTAIISGKQQDIVIGAGKMGRVLAFNRERGDVLWTTLVGRHENDQLALLPEGTTRVYPGPLGGVETPMAYSNGTVFVPYLDLYANWTPSTTVPGDLVLQPFSDGKGGIAAIEVNTGKILWDNPMSSINVGGATVVNDLVFTASYDGKIFAYRTSDGKEIWSYKASGGINAWPAVAGDMIVWPVGLGKPPSLIALGL